MKVLTRIWQHKKGLALLVFIAICAGLIGYFYLDTAKSAEKELTASVMEDDSEITVIEMAAKLLWVLTGIIFAVAAVMFVLYLVVYLTSLGTKRKTEIKTEDIAGKRMTALNESGRIKYLVGPLLYIVVMVLVWVFFSDFLTNWMENGGSAFWLTHVVMIGLLLSYHWLYDAKKKERSTLTKLMVTAVLLLLLAGNVPIWFGAESSAEYYSGVSRNLAVSRQIKQEQKQEQKIVNQQPAENNRSIVIMAPPAPEWSEEIPPGPPHSTLRAEYSAPVNIKLPSGEVFLNVWEQKDFEVSFDSPQDALLAYQSPTNKLIRVKVTWVK